MNKQLNFDLSYLAQNKETNFLSTFLVLFFIGISFALNAQTNSEQNNVPVKFSVESDNADLAWAPIGSRNAVVGGKENYRDLLVCRCTYEGMQMSGKVVGGNCNVASATKEYYTSQYEVLVNSTGATETWKKNNANQVPDGAVVSGKDKDGTIYYVGRVTRSDGSKHPGRVSEYRGQFTCEYGYSGKRYSDTVFEILVAEVDQNTTNQKPSYDTRSIRLALQRGGVDSHNIGRATSLVISQIKSGNSSANAISKAISTYNKTSYYTKNIESALRKRKVDSQDIGRVTKLVVYHIKKGKSPSEALLYVLLEDSDIIFETRSIQLDLKKGGVDTRNLREATSFVVFEIRNGSRSANAISKAISKYNKTSYQKPSYNIGYIQSALKKRGIASRNIGRATSLVVSEIKRGSSSGNAISKAILKYRNNSNADNSASSKELVWKPKGSLSIVDGGIENGNSLGICRCEYQGAKHSGKIVDRKCNFGKNGKEIVKAEYEVLTNPANIRTKWVKPKGVTIPEGAVVSGEVQNRKLYVGRVKLKEGSVHPGKVTMTGNNLMIYYGYGGRELSSRNFEILTQQ